MQAIRGHSFIITLLSAQPGQARTIKLFSVVVLSDMILAKNAQDLTIKGLTGHKLLDKGKIFCYNMVSNIETLLKDGVFMDRTQQYIKKIERLLEERSKLEHILLQEKRLIKGSVITRFKKCGRKYCRCVTENQPHGPYLYLSRNIEGKTRLKRIKPEEEAWVVQYASNYREFRKARERIVKINAAILDLINTLEEVKSENYPEDTID